MESGVKACCMDHRLHLLGSYMLLIVSRKDEAMPCTRIAITASFNTDRQQDRASINRPYGDGPL